MYGLYELLEKYIVPFAINIGAAFSYDWLKKLNNDDSKEAQTYRALWGSILEFCNEQKLEKDERITMGIFLKKIRTCGDIKWHLRDALEYALYQNFSDEQFEQWIELFNIECEKLTFAKNFGDTEIFTNRETVRNRLIESLKEIVFASLVDDIEAQTEGYENFGDYRELLKQISFYFNSSWKDTVISILSRAHYDDYVLDEHIEYIKSDEQYDYILSKCRTLMDHIDWEESDISNEDKGTLFNYLKYPHFNKVLLVSGTSGSGKSHFIKELIRDTSEKLESRDSVFLPCMINLSSGNIEKDIISSLEALFDEKNVTSVNDYIGLASALNIKICLIIENVNRILDAEDKKTSQFINAIRRFCRYDTFRFILTINEYEYYTLACHKDFISSYCINIQPSAFCGINIGEFNNKQGVVSGILENSNITPVIDLKLTTPLEAIYYASCVNGSTVPAPPSTYIGYIQMITAWKENELSKDGKEILVDLIKDITAQKSTIIFTRLNVKPFRDIQLLSTEKQNRSVFEVKYEDKYHLRIYPFWAAKIVGANGLAKSTIDLLSYPDELKEWLVSCYLFYGIEDEESFINQLKTGSFVDYALFLADKCDERLVRILYDYLVEDSVLIDTPRLAFAILHFISHCKLELSEIFELCVLVADAVCKFNLDDLYKSTLKYILLDVYDSHDLMVDMLILAKCSNETINHINGYAVCGRITDLSESVFSEPDFNINEIVVYLICSLQDSANLRKHLLQVKNKSFLDFFLRACYEYTLDWNKVDVKELFNLQKSFFKERKPIGAFIKRNLINAAGNLFSHKKYSYYQRKYINLVKELISNGETETAWFLVSNSIEHNYETLHPELYKILLKLTEDQRLMKKHGDRIEELYACQSDNYT